MAATGIIWNIAGVALCLPLMVGGCALFTNGLEWIGKKKHWSHGVVGSVLASVGTALPETSIPLIAILLLGSDRGRDIGVGAILGAPLVLTTVALAVAGIAALSSPARGKSGVAVHTAILREDLVWFLVAFALALLSSHIRIAWIRIAPALFLVGMYAFHIKGHFNEMRDGEADPPLLYILRQRPNPRLRYCVGQSLLGLAVILLVAYFFVARVQTLSLILGASPALLSLFVSPIASELPEMINSTIWMRQGRGTLALGNITGAILYQGTILAAIGMTFTSWHLHQELALAGVFSLAAAFFAIFALRAKNAAFPLLFSAFFFLLYLLLIAR